METRVPPTHRYPTRWKLGCRHNSRSSLSQEKRKRRKRHTRVMDLPIELIFNILLFLPAKLLQEVVRYVCKQWYDIISEPSFIRAHCQISTITTTSASFIIQSRLDGRKVYCLDKDVTKILFPVQARIKGSCNGLVLLCDSIGDPQKIYLANPLRKLIVSLPPIVPVVMEEPSYTTCSFAVNSSGQYKMVHFACYTYSRICEMGVFTIGFDKAWRRNDLQHLLGITMNKAASIIKNSRQSQFIGRFLYWPGYIPFLAMDVDTETLYQISFRPTEKFNRFCYRYEFISTETALGLMTEWDYDRGIWKLEKLTDVKSSEWTEIAMIDIGAMVTKVSNGKWTYSISGRYTRPLSLIDGELCFSLRVAFHTTAWMIRYNLANESFVCFEVKVPCDDPFCYHHVPTYVSPKNITLNSFKT
ncbi:uncharacterized protein LOC141655776 [Silene latifolia]|uniref:uncharacterized protein LOC141655776 n=1 Tax=Silene latifolia TaxID=37657 RepID=UPI003D783A95